MTDIDALLREEVGSVVGTKTIMELGGEDVEMFGSPLTTADIENVRKSWPDFTTNPSPGGMVHLIIKRAKDTNGNAVFKQNHRMFLEKLPIEKIVTAFNDLFGEHLDELNLDEDDLTEKKSS
jgi:hypothetical protein